MSRDQRISDNWALVHAQDLATETQSPLLVAFVLAPVFPGAGWRAYDFMLGGLADVPPACTRRNLGFELLMGDPGRVLPRLLSRIRAGALVTDFDPLRVKREWRKAVAAAVHVPFHEVDAHNIVPCRVASQKAEYGAYTLRPRLRRLIPDFLTPIPAVRRHPVKPASPAPDVDVERALRWLAPDRTACPVSWLLPGEKAADSALADFLTRRLARYATARNDPNADGQSGLSPYLHFGHLSAQRVATAARDADIPQESRDAFLEELVVRRELSDNFCFYNPDYDRVEGFPAWARKTLGQHAADARTWLYDRQSLQTGRTHDPLWNAAQAQMVRTGKMHGYLRMYWAKKLLEWTPTPTVALEMANTLNDIFELDGRDPNGYTGTAWAIGGVALRHGGVHGRRPDPARPLPPAAGAVRLGPPAQHGGRGARPAGPPLENLRPGVCLASLPASGALSRVCLPLRQAHDRSDPTLRRLRPHPLPRQPPCRSGRHRRHGRGRP
jgi:deoxyribodipyrimidine photo-lyase